MAETEIKNQTTRQTNENVETPKKKSPLRFIIIGLIVIVGLYFGIKAIIFATTHETTDDAQVETNIAPVLPRVGGYVKNILVHDYDSVRTGQLLLQLDDDELQTQLLQLQADSAAAAADIINAQAGLNNSVVSLGSNRGNIDLASIKVQQAQDDFKRNQNLYNDQAITKKQLDDSRYALEQAKQSTSNTQSDLSTAQSGIAVQKASVQKAQAALKNKQAVIDQLKLKISYTKIYAPQGGKIGKLNITQGQLVQAGAPLFSIVNDSTYWVIANFKETQIRKFHEGMNANIELDAFPDVSISGKVASLSDATGARFALLPPDNASGNFVKVTQRVPVKISIDDPKKYAGLLKAGLSADITIPTK